jgi:hypothetical protein
MGMSDNLKNYLQDVYGTCKQAQTEGKCECLSKHLNQHLCSNWTKTTATNWQDMMDIAKKQYASLGKNS